MMAAAIDKLTVKLGERRLLRALWATLTLVRPPALPDTLEGRDEALLMGIGSQSMQLQL